MILSDVTDTVGFIHLQNLAAEFILEEMGGKKQRSAFVRSTTSSSSQTPAEIDKMKEDENKCEAT